MRNTSEIRSYSYCQKRIFPWSMLPSNVQLASAVEKSGMIIEDWQNRGEDYKKTLLCWRENILKNEKF
jgi:cyclopropane fatty-acyl-phospholipid synthase-like methyltransferase